MPGLEKIPTTLPPTSSQTKIIKHNDAKIMLFQASRLAAKVDKLF